MDGVWIHNIIALIAVLLIPMTGLTIILISRLALKPLVETLAKALRDSGLASSSRLESQVQGLSEQLESLTGHIHRLETEQDFDRRLLEGSKDPASILG